MSLSIIKSAVTNRLNEGDGIVYLGDRVPIIDPASPPNGELPDLHITNPVVSATYINTKGDPVLEGTASLSVYALTTEYGDGVTLDVINLIDGCLEGWKPSPNVTTFVPNTIEDFPPVEKYRAATISFIWIA